MRPETGETGGHENHHGECWRKFKLCQIWSSTARCNRTVYVSFRSEDSRCGATPLLLLRDWVRVNRYIDYTAVSKNRASLVAENSYVELDNQISEIARSMRTKKKSWKCDKCVWDLRPERLGDSRIMNLGENQDNMPDLAQHTAATGLLCFPDLEQHRCRTGLFTRHRSEDSRCGATPLQYAGVGREPSWTVDWFREDYDWFPWYIGQKRTCTQKRPKSNRIKSDPHSDHPYAIQSRAVS